MSESTMKAAVNRLAKWRQVFAGWQLGTRSIEDPECQAVRDHREVTILMRAEINTLLQLLVEKKLITAEEYQDQLEKEAEVLSKDYEGKFPGMKATDVGITYDAKIAAQTMRHWKP